VDYWPSILCRHWPFLAGFSSQEYAGKFQHISCLQRIKGREIIIANIYFFVNLYLSGEVSLPRRYPLDYHSDADAAKKTPLLGSSWLDCIRDQKSSLILPLFSTPSVLKYKMF
jgi:hypothetical protein